MKIFRHFREGGAEVIEGSVTQRWTPEEMDEFEASRRLAREQLREPELLPPGDDA